MKKSNAGRKLHYYEYKGEYRTVKEISEMTGMHITTVRQRIYYGTPLDIPKSPSTACLVFAEKVFLEPVIK